MGRRVLGHPLHALFSSRLLQDHLLSWAVRGRSSIASFLRVPWCFFLQSLLDLGSFTCRRPVSEMSTPVPAHVQLEAALEVNDRWHQTLVAKGLVPNLVRLVFDCAQILPLRMISTR